MIEEARTAWWKLLHGESKHNTRQEMILIADTGILCNLLYIELATRSNLL